jgi:hypothetical protein
MLNGAGTKVRGAAVGGDKIGDDGEAIRCCVCTPIGENNGQNPGNAGLKQGYACLLPQMIKSWRREFSSRGASAPDFPFGVVICNRYPRSTLLTIPRWCSPDM